MSVPGGMPLRLLIVGGIAGVVLIGATALRRPQSDESPPSEAPIVVPDHAAAPAPSDEPVARYPVTIHRPDGPPRVAIDSRDALGDHNTVACSNCHSIRTPNPENRQPSDLNDFHLGMTFSHGTLACLSCHNPSDYDTLRLADNTVVEHPDVMTLCAQCHGPQYRDYQHGAHGGMNGYWDLTRGPRVRNNCVDCHDPHLPAYPKMQPTFKPKDRFLEPAHTPAEGDHE